MKSQMSLPMSNNTSSSGEMKTIIWWVARTASKEGNSESNEFRCFSSKYFVFIFSLKSSPILLTLYNRKEFDRSKVTSLKVYKEECFNICLSLFIYIEGVVHLYLSSRYRNDILVGNRICQHTSQVSPQLFFIL